MFPPVTAIWTRVRINPDHVQSTFSLSTLAIRLHRTSMLFALTVTSIAYYSTHWSQGHHSKNAKADVS